MGERLLGCGPEIGKVGGFRPVELPVVLRVFAEKVRAVGGVELGKAEPRRGQEGFAFWHECGYLFSAGVFEAAFTPLGTNRKAVSDEVGLMPAPHFDCGVVLPAVSRVGQGVKDLERFDTLLAESAVVKAGGRRGEVVVGEKGLNGSLLFLE